MKTENKRSRKPRKPQMKPLEAQPTEDFCAVPPLVDRDAAFYQPILAQLDLLAALASRSAARTQYWMSCE